MRSVLLAATLLTASGVAAQAQDVRGVLDNLNRAINPQQQQSEPQALERDRERIRAEEERYWRDYYGDRSDWRERAERDFGSGDRDGARRDTRAADRDADRLFSSDRARRLEYERLSDAERRRYDEAPSRERRRWDDEFSDTARQRWERMSAAERRRYEDEVRRLDRSGSGSSSDRRR